MSFYEKVYYRGNENGKRSIETPKKGIKRLLCIVFANYRELFKISLLFILCCLPVVTIGASVCAMLSVCKKISKEEYIFVKDDFFEAFKSNFKQGTILFWIYAGVMIGLWALLRICDKNLEYYGFLGTVMFAIIICMLIIFAAGFYGLLTVSTIKLKLSDIVKNSLLLTFISLKQTWGMVLIAIGIYALCFLSFPYSIFFLIPFGTGFVAITTVTIIYPVIEKYIAINVLENEKERDNND